MQKQKIIKIIFFTLIFFSFFGVAENVWAETYYVKNGGCSPTSESCDGKSDAEAWATISQVNNYTQFQLGDNIYFKCGSTWQNQILTVDWENFTVGAYYLNDSQIYTGENIPSELVRPTFQGIDTTILYRDYSTNGYPSNFYSALIQSSGYNGTFEDLRVINSGGIGIKTGGSVSNVHRCEVRSTANAGIMIYDAESGIHSKNYIYQPAKTAEMSGALGIINEPRDRAAGYGLVRCSGMTFRENTIEESYGEGFQTNIWGHDLIFESNTLINVARPNFNIYGKTVSDETYNIVIRKNIAFTKTNAMSYFKPWSGWAAAFVYLNDSSGLAVHDVYIYDNLIANKNTALQFGGRVGLTESSYNVFFYNNTVAGCKNGIIKENSYAAISGVNEIINNIFTNIEGCINVDTQVGSLDWRYNAFDNSPKSECNGQGTVFDGIILSKSDWVNINDLVPGNFRVVNNSSTINKGVNLGSPYNVDYFGTNRLSPQGNIWDIGAHEYTGSTTPTDTIPPSHPTGLSVS